jgi:capsular polysaccharide export protein
MTHDRSLAHACVDGKAAFPTIIHAWGFSAWKRKILRRFLHDHDVRFVSSLAQVPRDATLAVWGMTAVDPARNDLRIIRVEDGFLRSVGLGADLTQPLSWVLDSRGIYYNASQMSDIEHILHTTAFAPDQLARALRLRQRLVAHGVTKYNVGRKPWKRPAKARRVILVPGQVESDASLEYGTTRLRTNIALLRAVRKANTDAHIVFKPHPDVIAGLRKAGTDEHLASTWCDEIVTSVALDQLFECVDEVHVLTSLAGFEALMRGKKVTTYGQPFYAGWGLTTDTHPPDRQRKNLSLDALVAGTLILYPHYTSARTGMPIGVEEAVDELLDWRTRRTSHGARRLLLRPILRLFAQGRR